ncbi:MAG TPA: NlpC/P60 family protein [Flavipsychrobacter sp.]|nr:NlpC/P60 family protein [Flavipsychrobacter sp.]
MQRFRKLRFFTCLVLATLIIFTSCHSSKKGTANKPLSKKELKKKYAAILETKPRKIKNQQLYYFIDDWYGVKYKWGGNEKKGVDCSGFTKILYNKVYGMEVKRTVATLHETTKNFKRKRKLREGDLVYFQEEDDPSHVGVYLKNGYFVHSAKGKGVHISNIKDNYWKKIYAGGGKVKKKS